MKRRFLFLFLNRAFKATRPTTRGQGMPTGPLKGRWEARGGGWGGAGKEHRGYGEGTVEAAAPRGAAPPAAPRHPLSPAGTSRPGPPSQTVSNYQSGRRSTSLIGSGRGYKAFSDWAVWRQNSQLKSSGGGAVVPVGPNALPLLPTAASPPAAFCLSAAAAR